MSAKTLEKSPVWANEYLSIRDQASTLDPSCVLMNSDVQDKAWLAAHSELSGPVGQVSTALVNAFSTHGGQVWVTIQEDPETCDEKVAFEVRTSMEGREARPFLRRFVRESLPECAREFRDLMVFTVSPYGKAAL